MYTIENLKKCVVNGINYWVSGVFLVIMVFGIPYSLKLVRGIWFLIYKL